MTPSTVDELPWTAPKIRQIRRKTRVEGAKGGKNRRGRRMPAPAARMESENLSKTAA
jgi:hypothetical protein